MFADRTGTAPRAAPALRAADGRAHPAPRTARPVRFGSLRCIGFALFALMLGGTVPAVGVPVAAGRADEDAATRFSRQLDRDGNGIEDLLDAWRAGRADWSDLQRAAVVARPALDTGAKAAKDAGPLPASGPLAAGRLRVLCLGVDAAGLGPARAAGAAAGVCRVLQDGRHFGGFAVLDVDAAGLTAVLDAAPGGRVMLDRDGVPALVDSRPLIGVGRVTTAPLSLSDDWSATVAILDSGLDTAHGDLGDATDDDVDGPPPAVGDAADWFAADGGWPLFAGYKVVGWHDVTDDFPAAAGPWDYNYHGTALASVVAGSGAVDPDYRGVAAGARLTVVKYYDFDQIWRAWAGDFLAACAWLLDNHATYRVRTVLTAVNWDVDAGISDAMAALVDAGLLPVVAMGNFGENPAGPGYPAVLSDVLTVGAGNAAGAVSAYSGRGLEGDAKPDLIAPGGGLVPAAGRIVAADNEPNDTYSERFGTSLAAAHAAGAAYLLDEALLDNGIAPARDRAGVRTRQGILRLATALVTEAETADGSGTEPLPPMTGHDPARGFGFLRVDAAVRAVLDPLRPGQDRVDTLDFGWTRPVAARRLVGSPGVRYLVEAVPSGSLDLALEIVEIDAETGETTTRGQLVDTNGAGISEFAYHRCATPSWAFVVVRRVAGAGSVDLHLREADAFSAQGWGRALPGQATGAPNYGDLPPFPGPSLVIPSRVEVDPVARSLNVTDLTGEFRPGWPVFVFPAPSSQGGLTQPLVANIDGVPGDEIVVASDYGSVYFFTGLGAYKTVNLELNRSLTRPVGLRAATGTWRVAVVDRQGVARIWSWNASIGAEPELQAQVALGHAVPRAPAVGTLTPGGSDALVVAFADGWLGALDSGLNLLPGWPRDLGATLEAAPVLCDLDDDGAHEIIVPVRDGATGRLVMRVFGGDGAPRAEDGAVVPAPGGGGWLAIGDPVVAGAVGTGDLNIAVVGLGDNGLLGADARWTLGVGRLDAAGTPGVTDLQALQIAASTEQGVLQLERLVLMPTLAWNQAAGWGTEPGGMFHVRWTELLYGLTSIPGATTGWWLSGPPPSPFVRKVPLAVGGRDAAQVAHLSGMLVPQADGIRLRVEIIDDKLGIAPQLPDRGFGVPWPVARADGANRGALPLRGDPAAASDLVVGPRGLRAYPNPSGGAVRFRAATGQLARDATVEVFDLRGHRIRRLQGADAEGILRWDGRDARGRRLAAGAYLAVVRVGGERHVARVLLTR